MFCESGEGRFRKDAQPPALAPAEGKADLMPETVIYGISVVVLIAVAGLGLWFLRQSLGLDGVALFATKQRRLALVESTAIDGRRRMLLVRRDNVEHLIMTGGPVDVLLETGIAAAPRPAIVSIEAKAPPHGHGLNGREPVQLSDKVPPLSERVLPAASEAN
jgi:hypothetical protein